VSCRAETSRPILTVISNSLDVAERATAAMRYLASANADAQRDAGLSLLKVVPKCERRKYSRFMRRRLAVVVGLAMLGGGAWLIATEHSRTMTCTAATNLVSGVANSCQDAAWLYLAGVVAIGFGLIVILFASLMRRHETRSQQQGRLPSDYTLQLRQARDRGPASS
jgi:hypothetical protein